MATIPVKDANGVIVPLEKPLIPGQTTMANSRPVVVASDQTAIPISGSVTISGTATISGTVAATQSGAWTVAQSGTWTVRNQDGSGNALTSATRGAQQALSVQIVDASGAQITSFGGTGAVTQSGVWSVRNQDGAGNLLTSAARGAQQALSVQIVDASGAQITTFGGAGGTSSNFGSAFPTAGTAIGGSDGTNMVGLRVKTTAPVAGDPALVVGISPSSLNNNGQTTMANSSPVVLASDQSAVPISGTIATMQSGIWTVQPGNTPNTTPWLTSISQGGNTAAVKAGSTAPAPGDQALVVAISPNSQNPNGQTTAANSSPVVLASDQTVPNKVVATANGCTSSRVDAAASTNATSLKASAGNLINIDVFNVATYTVFMKFYNKASAPTVGTDTPVWTLPIPSNTGFARTFTFGKSFATGIAYAITKLQADSDTTVVVAHDLTGAIDWV